MTNANAPIRDMARAAQDELAQRPELLTLLATVSQDFAASPAMEATTPTTRPFSSTRRFTCAFTRASTPTRCASLATK